MAWTSNVPATSAGAVRRGCSTAIGAQAKPTSSGAAIADVAATLGVDEPYLGASSHTALAHLLHGSVVQQAVKNLPDDIAVVIRG